MTRISFSVPSIPVAQPRHRIGVVGGKGRAFGAKKSHPVHAFKATVRLAASQAYQGAPLDGPLHLRAVFVMPRSKSQIWKKRPMLRMWHTKAPDKDNLEKSLLDALTGLIWATDAQVCASKTVKVIAAGDEQPHVEVTIRVLA